MKRDYIGLACSPHDPSLAILDSDARIVFAEGAERFLQAKRASNCPPDHFHRIHHLLDEHSDEGAHIVAAKSWSAHLEEKSEGMLTDAAELLTAHTPGETGISAEAWYGAQWSAWPRSLANAVAQAGLNLEHRLRERHPRFGLDITWRRYDHHRTHAAFACFTSPFDEALCAILDGQGEGIAYAFFRYRDGDLDPIPAPRGIGSLGVLYYEICWACGFDPVDGEEWKVMGLAAYGQRDEALYELIRPILHVDGLSLRPGPDAPRRVEQLLSLRRRRNQPAMLAADLAHTGQLVFCELEMELLSNLFAEGGSRNLVLGGGCALNSSANGQIVERTPFEALFVPPAPADDGNALGAAMLAYQEDHGYQVHWRDGSPYLGSRMSTDTIERVSRLGGLRGQQLTPDALAEKAADLLAAGKILGWVQGRAEFGPRALGNRSILADPRAADVKERLNATVKFREEFRPFAPAILHEHGEAYFESYQESRYMERTLRFRKEVHPKVPGVVHVDGTGRLQTVKREWNEGLHALLVAFHRRTGVPILLNTSFNVMGKPIVHTVEDALAVFFTTGIDALVIDDALFEK